MNKAEKMVMVCEVAVSAATLYMIVRAAIGPNGLKTARMAVARSAEGFCMTQAKGWASLADVAHRAYENGRGVTV